MPSTIEPSGYVLEPLRESGEFTLCCGRQDGSPSPVLAVALAAEQPSPQVLRRLEDAGQLVADAPHCTPERTRPLEQLVQEKTGGNPFFAIQFFTALAEEGQLAFDSVARAWQWDIDRIRAKNSRLQSVVTGALLFLHEEMQYPYIRILDVEIYSRSIRRSWGGNPRSGGQ